MSLHMCRPRLVDGVKDCLSGLSPLEGFGVVLIVSLDVETNLVSQLADTGKDAPMDRSSLELGRPGLDRVEPGRTRGCEMKMEAGVLLQEALDGVRLVRAAVVQDEMQIDPGRRRLVDLPQEVKKLLRPVFLGDPAQDLAGRDVKGGDGTLASRCRRGSDYKDVHGGIDPIRAPSLHHHRAEKPV